MLTYVINTSENKTFDSSRLFDLAGYNKIRWMHCSLNNIGTCAKEIYEKQNFLGADAFRVAVLVDFFGFNRIRPPYGRGEFGFGTEEKGVDFSLYLPYIEAYMIDNLFNPLNRKEVYASAFEVYYIQNGKYERFQNLSNAEAQLASILSGKPGCERPIPEVVPSPKAEEEQVEEDENCEDDEKFEGENPEEPTPIKDKLPDIVTDPTPYTTYSLYCTETVSLDFKLADYPYGAAGDALDFHSFFKAFQQRSNFKTSLRRHYFVTSYGESPARAAFDTLSLSLYLIRMYEREEHLAEEGELEISRLEPHALRGVLEKSWNKIQTARNVAKGNRTLYYSLTQNGQTQDVVAESTAEDYETAIQRHKAEVAASLRDKKLSAEEMYHQVCELADRDVNEIEEDNRETFDGIMDQYLKKRDETCETNVEADFEEMRLAGVLITTDQCPSKEEYSNLLKAKHEEISALFKRALDADYIDVNYNEEKHNAKSAYQAYCKARSCMSKNFLGDLIFLIVTLLVMLIPYGFLQLRDASILSLGTSVLYTMGALIFGGLFVLALVFQVLPQLHRMRKAKDWLFNAYITSLAKDQYAFSKIRRRYETDLIRIEEKRYELRQYKHLYDANVAMERNTMRHRVMLEEVQDQLSGMLNNLGVEPVYHPDESVEGEFDLTKSFRSRENSVYKVFSIEVIEAMFPKKGSDGQ